MANLILNLLFFGSGMLFGLLLYADAIEIERASEV
jgi:hypothetical protein